MFAELSRSLCSSKSRRSTSAIVYQEGIRVYVHVYVHVLICASLYLLFFARKKPSKLSRSAFLRSVVGEISTRR